MNIERVRKLATYMRSLDEKQYDQTDYGRETACGVVACLAGHTVVMERGKLPHRVVYGFNSETVSVVDDVKVRADAAQLLDVGEMDRLFTSCPEQGWPEEFADRWDYRLPKAADKSRRPTHIAADYLDFLADQEEARLAAIERVEHNIAVYEAAVAEQREEELVPA